MVLQANYAIPDLPPTSVDFQTPELLIALVSAHRYLAELKGCAASIPNQGILINTLALQEAKASSEVESYVTTQDELFQADLHIAEWMSPAAKEVSRYREALTHGFERMRQQRGILSNGTLIALFQLLKNSSETFRTSGGTVLKNERTGATVFVPPQDGAGILAHMQALERFINDETACDLDPLIKMALIHHQFESIHPFSDGNGRIGRILCVLYLVRSGLLDTPVLYLSRYINQHKGDYYRLLQTVRDEMPNVAAWQAWVVFMLNAVADTAQRVVQLVGGMRDLMAETKRRMRADVPKLYSQDLLNNLFRHPYTRIEFVQRDLRITRQTAARYLRQLAQVGLVQEHSQGKHLYFINAPLVQLLVQGEK
ncbi:Fic family protein [Pseudothauera nasutitermitis]|uniref:Fic family protein n=1 Tax=Pseudothauera nasutitermitis TaxID=2565930 RepID=A0A4S4ASU2_9RHOO|nr:Fic/DOC family N-terminal domain-containing protein [Pseudothauera nasutitermitis]THF62924.1 Fic family protein [Pseudothauera nasutitermitis]